MAKEKKVKTKKVPFEKTATEVAGRMNVWEWECGGRRWRWGPFRPLNLEVFADGVWQVIAYLPDVKSAGYFVEGVSLGAKLAKRELEAQAEEKRMGDEDQVDSPSHEKLP